jgi:hypothetical protein
MRATGESLGARGSGGGYSASPEERPPAPRLLDATSIGAAFRLAVVLGCLALVSLSVVTGRGLDVVPPVAAVVVLLFTWHRTVLSWRWLIAMVMAVILFIPIKKYTLPAGLPFSLEPYRVLVAAVFAVWLLALLVDPAVRIRRTIVDGPLLSLGAAVAVSMIVNPDRVAAVGPDSAKRAMFFFSFVLLVYLVASVLSRFSDVDFALKWLTLGGAVVAAFALVESRTGYNAFDHLGGIIPFVDAGGFFSLEGRGARLRVFASSQHPIALGVALVLLVPLAVYRAVALAKRSYWLVALVLLTGAFATVSRTAVTAIAAATIVLLILRWRDLKRYWPAAIVFLVVVHLAIPGTLGTLRASFFPEGGLIAEQTDQRVGSGRLATLGPTLREEFKPNPFIGEGYATRVTRPDEYNPVPNAPITDDQWLDLMLETGLVGVLAGAWLFVRAIRRLSREARRDDSERGWLAAALAASVAAYGVAMFTFDAFSFIQATFVFFLILGLGCALVNTPREEPLASPANTRLPRGTPEPEPLPGSG